MAHNVSGASLNGILGRLNQTGNTHPYDAVTFGDWTMQAGDLVTVKRGETEYTSPVHSSRMIWNGAPEVTIQSVGRKEREPISKVSKKKYGRGGAGIRNGQEFYHDIYDQNGFVRSQISNTERGFEAKLVNIVDDHGNITGSSIATAINEHNQAGVKISGAWVKIDGTTTINDVMTITEQRLSIKVPMRVSGDIMVSSLTLRSGSDSVMMTEADASGFIKRAYIDGNNLVLIPMTGSQITFSKATTLTGDWSGSYQAGKRYEVSASPQGNTHYSPYVNKIAKYGSPSWDSAVYNQRVLVQDEDDNSIYLGQIDVANVYNDGIAFQTGKIVPFIGDQSNEAYNGRKTSITSNGTYYACAEGYKSRTEGYDNANYSSDRYAGANPFTVNVPNTPSIDTIWASDHIPGGAAVYENDAIRRVYESARADHDNFCIQIKCGDNKVTYYCET